jgi:hypothetical protein
MPKEDLSEILNKINAKLLELEQRISVLEYKEKELEYKNPVHYYEDDDEDHEF